MTKEEARTQIEEIMRQIQRDIPSCIPEDEKKRRIERAAARIYLILDEYEAPFKERGL